LALTSICDFRNIGYSTALPISIDFLFIAVPRSYRHHYHSGANSTNADSATNPAGDSATATEPDSDYYAAAPESSSD
jgi:hypothetical protein